MSQARPAIRALSRYRRIVGAGLGLLLFLAPARLVAQDWAEAYGRGLQALQQGQAGRAVLQFQQAIRLHPQPENRVVFRRGGRSEQYWPYLRLAQALVQAKAPGPAREALEASERFGIEPESVRARVRAAIEALEKPRGAGRPEARTPTPPEPTPTPAEPEPFPEMEPAVPVATPEPAGEAAPGLGSLELFSDPPGAAVYVDDEFVGSTDGRTGRLVKSGVDVGIHRVRMSAAGRRDFEGSVEVAADATSRLVGSLPEPRGRRLALAALFLVVLGGLVTLWLRRRSSEPEPDQQRPVAGRTAAPAARSRARESGPGTSPAAPSPTSGEARLVTLSGMETVATPPAAGPGDERFGSYRIVDLLGRGGMATVHKVERNGELFALKRPLKAHLEDAAFLERFLREAEIGRTLHHPNIVRIFERGDIEGVPYFTMELLEGETLQQRLRREGACAPDAAARVVVQVAEALDYAHLKGVIHRDLKPSNVMLLRDGAVKVTDYGIARARRYEGQGLTTTGAFLGTPDYVAPETAEGRGSDARSDLYGLGVVLYELLTARKPFVGITPFETLKKHCSEPPTPPSSFVPSLPPALEAIVLKLMRKEPAERYANAEELLIELRDYLNR